MHTRFERDTNVKFLVGYGGEGSGWNQDGMREIQSDHGDLLQCAFGKLVLNELHEQVVGVPIFRLHE